MGKRELFLKETDGGRIPYYATEPPPKPKKNIESLHQSMYDHLQQELNYITKEDKSPGPGHYHVKEPSFKGHTYRNLFKSNISHSEEVQREALPPIR